MVETIKQIGAGEEVIGGLQIGWEEGWREEK